MRFSAVFESKLLTMPVAPSEDRAGMHFNVVPADLPKPEVEDVAEDLAQRVREIGEWQLEDW